MANLQQSYDKAMMSFMQYHAAWPAQAATYAVGAYGKFVNGVFQITGNLHDHTGLTITPIVLDDSPLKDVHFESSNIKSQAYVLNGSVETPVEVIPNSPSVSADLQYTFSDANGYSVDCTDLSLTVISENPADYFQDTVWPALHAQGRQWDNSLKIIYRLYVASNYVLMGSSQKNSVFNLSGTGSALFSFGKGTISGGLSLVNTQNAEINLFGYNLPQVIGFDLMSFNKGGQAILPNN